MINPLENPSSSIPEDRVPLPVPRSSVEREVYIAAGLKKSQERINQAFAKYLYAKLTEQASALALGNIPSTDQNVLPNMEDDDVATPEDNPTFDETVCHLSSLRITLPTSDVFL